jgi:hypothetical protein
VSDQFKSALMTWANTDSAKTIATAGGTAFITTFVARFGGEGACHTRRDRTGEVHAGDVAPKPT